MRRRIPKLPWAPWPLLVVAGLLLVTLVGVLVFEVLPDVLAPDRTRGFGVAAEARARADVRTSALQFAGGLVIAIGAALTARNVQLTKERNRIEHESQITERFTRAIDQLGSEKLDIRLGGIYALERIARDSPADHGPIMEVLTAVVREHASSDADADQDSSDDRARLATDIQATLTVLGRRETGSDVDGAVLDLRSVAIAGANLDAAALAGANLFRVRLAHGSLVGAQLTKAVLSRADLRGADLEDALLERAAMYYADLRDSNLACARLKDARLSRAKLDDASLQFAELTGASLMFARAARADFSQAILQGSVLRRTDLRDSLLMGALLDKADLRGAQLAGANLTDASLEGARLDRASFDAKTVWPEGFDPRARGLKEVVAS